MKYQSADVAALRCSVDDRPGRVPIPDVDQLPLLVDRVGGAEFPDAVPGLQARALQWRRRDLPFAASRHRLPLS